MHPGENATERCLFRSSSQARERTIHSRQNLGSHVKLEMVFVKEGSQHLLPGGADDRMSPGVGGVWGRVADLGKPVGIRFVSGLPSVAAVRIAVTGRQKL